MSVTQTVNKHRRRILFTNLISGGVFTHPFCGLQSLLEGDAFHNLEQVSRRR